MQHVIQRRMLEVNTTQKHSDIKMTIEMSNHDQNIEKVSFVLEKLESYIRR